MPDDHIHSAQPHTPPAPRRAESDNHAAGRAQPQPAAPPRTLMATVKNALWSKAPAPAGRQHDSFREIVETVVFVVVLVLLLKSFIAEAFVIPTGSMADTLWGYQKVITCPQCGYAFPVNSSQEVDPPKGRKPEPVTHCVCQNCLLPIHLISPQRDGRMPDPQKGDEVLDPGPNSGDRVLVVKYLYDLFPGRPNRFDVVVFKYPGDSSAIHETVEEALRNGTDHFPNSGPQQNWVQMNYIKRLVGLGNETIGIYYGDLYVMEGGISPPGPNDVPQRDLWKKKYMREDEPEALELLLEGKRFKILQKAPDKILAMRRLVYDNDKPAKDLEGVLPPRWAAAEDGPWAKAEAHGFRHTPKDETTLSWLRYRHILRGNNPKPQLITDFLAYNSYEPRPLAVPGPNWVGDLILECDVTVDDPKGDLVLELSRSAERYRARFELSTGKCTLWRLRWPHEGEQPPEENAYTEIGSAMTAVKAKGTYHLRFANVDQRLTVWMDGKLPFGDGVSYADDPPKRRGPCANDLQPASIGVKGGRVSVQHLKLWRDTYYTRQPGGSDGAPEGGDWSDPQKWGPLQKLAGKTFYVQPGHYLCLGDNSPESSDSRHWGAVPERLMLGRALLVYYPFYFPYWPLKSPVNRIGAIE